MSAINSRRWIPLSVIAILMIAVIGPRPDDPGVWLETLFDWLHVPLFGLVSLALLSLAPATWTDTRRFGFALAGSLVLAVTTEAIQIPLPHDADWKDVVADGIGAFSFLLIARMCRTRVLSSVLLFAVGTTLLTVSALPVISLTNTIVSRNAQFPVIFDGAVDARKQFVRQKSARVSSYRSQERNQSYTRVELLQGRWPGLTIDNLFPDWRPFSNLLLDLELEGDRPIVVTIRIHDRQHSRGDQLYEDRYNREFKIAPGRNSIQIGIDEIRAAPDERDMDTSAIESLTIFSSNEFAGRVFRLYEIKLN